jgi:cytochrome c oxidase subunit II
MPMAQRARVAAGAGLAGAATLGCRVPMDSFDPISPQGLAISNLFNVALVLSGVVFLVVASVLAYAVTRFRGQPGDPEPPQLEGNRRLEILWTAIPLLLLAAMFFLVLRTMGTVNAEPPSALRVRVIGHQWWWEFQYPEQGVVTANELHLPLGEASRLELEADDVIHSFWVPHLGWKKDTIPGKTNVMVVEPDRAGIYDGACTEYCGVQHAWMRIRVEAEPGDRFEAWVREQQAGAAPPSGGAVRGEEIFFRNTCVNCHAVRGTAATQQVGPDLTHFGGRSTIGAGVLENTPANLRRWVREVQSVKPGALMPDYSDLSDAELDALVEYLEGLK